MQPWKSIKIGDVVKIENTENKFIPADMVLLNSEGIDGICYVETKNLDGETNLKLKQAPKELNEKYTDNTQLKQLSG
jgi:P-type E1-E2 ATPase